MAPCPKAWKWKHSCRQCSYEAWNFFPQWNSFCCCCCCYKLTNRSLCTELAQPEITAKPFFCVCSTSIVKTGSYNLFACLFHFDFFLLFQVTSSLTRTMMPEEKSLNETAWLLFQLKWVENENTLNEVSQINI